MTALNRISITHYAERFLLALRVFCLFFIQQSHGSVEGLTQDNVLDTPADDINLPEQYASLWSRSAELITPLCQTLMQSVHSEIKHEALCAVRFASQTRNILTFIASVCFTMILKTCRYALLDKATQHCKDPTLQNTQFAFAIVCFFLPQQRNELCI